MDLDFWYKLLVKLVVSKLWIDLSFEFGNLKGFLEGFRDCSLVDIGLDISDECDKGDR